MTGIRSGGLLFLSALFLGAGFHLALGDYLLFLSDWHSLAVYLGALAIVILPFLIVTAMLCRMLAKQNFGTIRRVAAFIVGLIVAVSALDLVAAWLIGLIDWPPLSRILRHPFYLVAICFPFAVAAVHVQRHDDSFARRVEDLGLVAGLAFILLVGSSVVTGLIPRNDTADLPRDRKQLVLVVLDGMPAQHLAAYNDKARTTALDAHLKRARVFTGMHTSTTWTNGYFGTLYAGSEGIIRADPSAGVLGLVSRLQLNQIGVRWLSFHRNGFPEGSAALSGQYVGLRSYMLMQNVAWIPEVLGLDYHIALSGSAIDQNLTSDIARWFYRHVIGGIQARDDVLAGILLPQLQKMRRHSERSLVLFHVMWSSVGPIEKDDYNDGDAVETLPAAQERAGSKNVSEQIDLIRRADYRYGPELEWIARSKRRAAAIHMKATARHLANFLDALESDPALRKTAVIVTADHGNIYGKGRFWYGFHPNVEVVRVPFILFNAGLTGRDDRLFATPDLHRSILEYFAVAPDNATDGRSVFGDKGHDAVVSLTSKSDRNREWFFVVTTPARRYEVNLHPKGDGRTTILDRDGYNPKVLERTSQPPTEICAVLARSITRYGIDPADIHPAVRPIAGKTSTRPSVRRCK